MVVKRRGQNEHLKQGERTKTNLYSIISKLTLIHENITNSNILIVLYIYMCELVYVCVCVCNTTKLQKRIVKLKCLFSMIRNR